MSVSETELKFVFIIGSPRSGTTVLGEILDKHEAISQWYEPYFVWDHYFRDENHDERFVADAAAKIREQIYNDFKRYRKSTGSSIIVDKSPRNSLKIPFIRRIFPGAYFIHLIRDGRDVTLSINKEWTRRNSIVQNAMNKGRFDYKKALGVINEWLGRQPFLRDKMRAFWFETHCHFLDRSRHLNRLRWNGEVGWGPRFKGWEDIIQQTSMLQFNAYQWVRCIEGIQENWFEIPEEKKLEIRYETLTDEGENTLERILEFINLKSSEQFYSSIPVLKKGNFNKWRKQFSPEQLSEIQDIVGPKLIELGYENSLNWK
jgi:hypothetical protein